jgi:hypothetical protein
MASYAASHSYYIVANGRGDFYNMLGRAVPLQGELNVSDGSVHGHRVTVARLDMDQGLCIGAVYDQ